MWLAPPERGADLERELARSFPGLPVAAAGPANWLISPDPGVEDAPAIAFASQIAPGIAPVGGESVSKWGEAIGRQLIERLPAGDGPWRFHILLPEDTERGFGRGRGKLIEREVMEFLKKRQRRLIRSLNPAAAPPFLPGESLAQAVLISSGAGWIGVADANLRHRFRRIMSPFPGGEAPVADDRFPPSRAYRKLLEAEQHLGVSLAAGESCVELGASPGGWSAIVLRRGVRLIAIDRSPLRADLMRSPHLQFIRGDAFRFQPEQSVDWLLSDLIASTDRLIDLLTAWIAARWCRRFIFTIKFKGDEDYPRLEPLKQFLDQHCTEYKLRCLRHNRNEVTAMGLL